MLEACHHLPGAVLSAAHGYQAVVPASQRDGTLGEVPEVPHARAPVDPVTLLVGAAGPADAVLIERQIRTRVREDAPSAVPQVPNSSRNTFALTKENRNLL